MIEEKYSPWACPTTGEPHRFYGNGDPSYPAGCMDCDWGKPQPRTHCYSGHPLDENGACITGRTTCDDEPF
jgi:hypothetical protein